MKSNLTEAILAVMGEVKGIDKSMQVGTGRMQYKGVPDQEVKKIIGSSMQKNGLVMLPIKIEPTTRIDRWEQTDQYGTKQKQSVFTEVVATYKLMHVSGESIELSGYGHGTDTQDKGAGKATTYALKYTLLYAFLVPTGKIDDTDTIHSEQVDMPSKKVKQPIIQKAKLDKDRFGKALHQISINKYSAEAMRDTFSLSAEQEKEIVKLEELKTEIAKQTEDEKK